MLRKRYAGLIALVTLPGLAGCVQATRHSNTMVFGTNTTVGVKVGQDVNQMPQVLIAYDRQEAVIMPLLANTREAGDGKGNKLSPCNPGNTAETIVNGKVTNTDTTFERSLEDVHPCKFVAIRQNNSGLVVQDSYSVLASFGARIEGDAKSNKGAVGLAQYFATGVAAQNLAISGGAAVVAVGEGAKASAENEAASANAAAATGAENILAGAVTDAEKPSVDTMLGDYNEFKNDMAEALSSTQPADWNNRWTAFTGSTQVLPLACPTQATCQTKFGANATSPFLEVFLSDSEKMKMAASLWCKNVSSDAEKECSKS